MAQGHSTNRKEIIEVALELQKGKTDVFCKHKSKCTKYPH
jgi:hypothetical protein